MPLVFQTWMSLKEGAMAVFFSPLVRGSCQWGPGNSSALPEGQLVTAVSSMLPIGEFGRAWKLLLLRTCLRLCLVPTRLQSSQTHSTWEHRLAAVAAYRRAGLCRGGLSLVLFLLHCTSFPSTNPFLLLWGLVEEPVAQGYSLLSFCRALQPG